MNFLIPIDYNFLDVKEEYLVMLNNIQENFPAIKKQTENFYKSQSQFMDNMLTVSAPTEMRNLRQILAEINKSKDGIIDGSIKIRKKEIEIKCKERAKASSTDVLQNELLDIDILEIRSQIDSIKNHINAAIRKVNAYVNQYNNILKKIGKEVLTEEDFEKDEERYHIMKAFEQGLCAARSHGGIIDEGNQIYFHQIGINGMTAQIEVTRYLLSEAKEIEQKREPTHEMQMQFLEEMANKFAGCAVNYAKRKGMVILDKTSLNVMEEANNEI